MEFLQFAENGSLTKDDMQTDMIPRSRNQSSAEKTRTRRQLVSIALIGMCLALACTTFGHEVEFGEERHGTNTKVVVTRGGELVYEVIQKGAEERPIFLYRFFWKSKPAATVLIVGGTATIQQVAELPVSYSISLDARQHPAIVSIEDAKGAIIDGLLQKDGKLTPLDFSKLRGITKEAEPGAPGNAPSSHP